MKEFLTTVARKAPTYILVGGLVLGGTEVTTACADSSSIAACGLNWPNASTPRVGNTAVAFGAFQAAIAALRANIIAGDSSGLDGSNFDSNGPFYEVGSLSATDAPAAGAIFAVDNQDGMGIPDYELGPSTRFNNARDAFCGSGGSVYLNPAAVTAIGDLLIAGIQPGIDNGFKVVTVSPAPSS